MDGRGFQGLVGLIQEQHCQSEENHIHPDSVAQFHILCEIGLIDIFKYKLYNISKNSKSLLIILLF